MQGFSVVQRMWMRVVPLKIAVRKSMLSELVCHTKLADTSQGSAWVLRRENLLSGQYTDDEVQDCKWYVMMVEQSVLYIWLESSVWKICREAHWHLAHKGKKREYKGGKPQPSIRCTGRMVFSLRARRLPSKQHESMEEGREAGHVLGILMIYIYVCLSLMWLMASKYLLPWSLLCMEKIILVSGISYLWMNQPWKCAGDCMSDAFVWTSLFRHKITGSNLGGRNDDPDFFFFSQNLLILSMLLILMHLSHSPLLVLIIACQKRNCPVFSYQVANRGKGRDSWPRRSWIRVHRRCVTPLLPWEDLLLLSSVV